MLNVICDRCGKDAGARFTEMDVSIPLTSPMVVLLSKKDETGLHRSRTNCDLCAECLDSLEEWFKVQAEVQ